MAQPIRRATKAIAGLCLFVWACHASAQTTCRGDCNKDGRVAINELVLAVRIATSEVPIASCPGITRAPTSAGVSIFDLWGAVHDSINSCRGPVCGDGVLDRGETCEPHAADDVCRGLCLDNCTCPTAVCGNGVAERGEECDGADVAKAAQRNIIPLIPGGSSWDCTACRINVDNTANVDCRFWGCARGAGPCVIVGPNDPGTCIHQTCDEPENRACERLDEFRRFCTENPRVCIAL